MWKLLTHWAVNYYTNKFIPVTFPLPVAQGREAISHSMISKEQLWTQFYAGGQKKKYPATDCKTVTCKKTVIQSCCIFIAASFSVLHSEPLSIAVLCLYTQVLSHLVLVYGHVCVSTEKSASLEHRIFYKGVSKILDVLFWWSHTSNFKQSTDKEQKEAWNSAMTNTNSWETRRYSVISTWLFVLKSKVNITALLPSQSSFDPVWRVTFVLERLENWQGAASIDICFDVCICIKLKFKCVCVCYTDAHS